MAAAAGAGKDVPHKGPDVVGDAKSYMIHVRINEAKNVLAKDSNGKSDPYVTLAVGGDVSHFLPFLSVRRSAPPAHTHRLSVPQRVGPIRCEQSIHSRR